MNSPYMTEAELAQILKVSKSTLHKLRTEGTIPFRLVGTCIRYFRDDIDAWIKGRSFNATSTQIPTEVLGDSADHNQIRNHTESQ